MTQFPVSTSSEQSIHAALELSKNSWLLAIQVPEPVGLGTHRRSPRNGRIIGIDIDWRRERNMPHGKSFIPARSERTPL